MSSNKLFFEYRSFGQSFGHAEIAILKMAENTTPQESVDYYILSETNEVFNVLIRNAKLVVKELIAVEQNLEKWNVNNKEVFPLKKTFIENVFYPCMGLEAPSLEKYQYTLPEFIDEIINRDPDLKLVEVYKKKREFNFNNCNCEYTEVLVNSAYIKTINIESETTQHVLNLLNYFQIDASLPGKSYLTKIKEIIGQIPLKNLTINESVSK